MVTGPIVHDGDMTFEAAEALSKFDLVYVSAAGKVSKTTGATDAAIGIVDRAYALGATDVSVISLNRGRVQTMRSSAAITLGGYVTGAADGEIADWVHADTGDIGRRLGVALTAAAGADEEVEVYCL